MENFFKQYKYKSFKKGELLIKAYEDPSGIFFLKNGLVKQYSISKQGEELIVNVFKPKTFFPMSWAINLTPNVYYFEATEPSEGWLAPREDIIEFLKKNSDILFDLIGRVYKGTDGLLTKLVYLMSGDAYTRVITELLICAKRFGKSTENSKSLEIRISEKDIANLTGMARETVSREIKILKNKDLVNFKKSIFIITDLDKLEAELSVN